MSRVLVRFGRYVGNILVAVDQLANTLLGGDPDETISSRAAKGQLKGDPKWCLLCRLLDLIQKNHCAKSLEADEGKSPPPGWRRPA